jgi:two-component system phosphate regulon response regulator PhoB
MPDTVPALPLGFRGFAAGFQPELDGFYRLHHDLLGGLTRIDSVDTFLSCITDMRPDYLLLGQTAEPAGLLSAIRDSARSAHLAVLVAGEASAEAGTGAPGLAIEPVARDASGGEVSLILRAMMRRTRPQAMVGRSTWNALELDEACLTLSVYGEPVSLNLEVFSVLGVMLDDPDRVWDRLRLHRLVFGATSGNDIRAIDTRISRARRHVASVLGLDPIRTVRGVGYALVPDP